MNLVTGTPRRPPRADRRGYGVVDLVDHHGVGDRASIGTAIRSCQLPTFAPLEGAPFRGDTVTAAPQQAAAAITESLAPEKVSEFVKAIDKTATAMRRWTLIDQFVAGLTPIPWTLRPGRGDGWAGMLLQLAAFAHVRVSPSCRGFTTLSSGRAGCCCGGWGMSARIADTGTTGSAVLTGRARTGRPGDRARGRRGRPVAVRGGAAVTGQKLDLAKVHDDGYRPSNDGLTVSEHIAIVQRAQAIAATDHAALVRAQRELAEVRAEASAEVKRLTPSSSGRSGSGGPGGTEQLRCCRPALLLAHAEDLVAATACGLDDICHRDPGDQINEDAHLSSGRCRSRGLRSASGR